MTDWGYAQMNRLDPRQVRQTSEDIERQSLSPRAQLSSESAGRSRPESPDKLRTAFQVDRDRILHSPAFRRLKFKTQVFIEPLRDDTRTRLTHTLEVMQISRTVARALRLNEDLTEAIALGHDIGHTPFAHVGESVLDELSENGFHHSFQSVRMAEKLERQGQGLNLTKEVKNGILTHSKTTRSICDPVSRQQPLTSEGKLVRLCDSIAYLNHDIEDAVKVGLLKESSLPEASLRVLGKTSGARIARSVEDIINTSIEQDEISISSRVKQATDRLRTYLFENLYSLKTDSAINNEARMVIENLYNLFDKNPHLIYQQLPFLEKVDSSQPAVDFLSIQSDFSIIRLYRKFFDDTLSHLPHYE